MRDHRCAWVPIEEPRLTTGCDRAIRHLGDPPNELVVENYVYTRALDPWRFGAQALDLSRAGLRMAQFPQHDARLVPASERLSAAILERRLRHPGDPVLDAHVAAAVAK
jgi:hypothetical protein